LDTGGLNSLSIRQVLYLSVILGGTVVWVFRDFSSLRTHVRGALIILRNFRDEVLKKVSRRNKFLLQRCLLVLHQDPLPSETRRDERSVLLTILYRPKK
jgi:hypothetical protein